MNQDSGLEYFMGKLDPPYESKEQAQIGHMLDKYGIPFFYKQATLVQDQDQRKVIHVDFSLPTYNGVVIDYIADPNSRDYQHKKILYYQNQIPAVLITPEYFESPTWQQELYKKLKELYCRPLNIDQESVINIDSLPN